MTAPAYPVSERNRPLFRDASVLQCAPAPISGTAGTPVSVIGEVETVEFNFKRDFTETTAADDVAESSRAKRWGKGSVKLSGFSKAVGSAFAAIFAAGSHVLLQFTETATGDSYQLTCTNEDFAKSMGKEATKDTLTLGVEGIPYYASAAGTLAAMTLEA